MVGGRYAMIRSRGGCFSAARFSAIHSEGRAWHTRDHACSGHARSSMRRGKFDMHAAKKLHFITSTVSLVLNRRTRSIAESHWRKRSEFNETGIFSSNEGHAMAE